ncbi:glutamate N-acetyltransferase [Streptomyces sp. KhCrAH-43]|uniref:bifunctional glutamate N-acetyltransferase/amino-acid acetyltransferase ArgJ n=1 Tax=unclassified Streptomyces TaxID=2593676 RepID=UPI0003A8360D|nr:MULTISPECIES: bifunctional glutamate N-acetyltransferase/amino-acid acetyltransferase ArgJ [unclassified Streptomyces]MYS33248.1 bifunctional glutamate N-acetyltransferase/amino-acid acetyltransferase ArgJ [Streptomyces sp. SID4920]MYX67553.1 bifunctional glutamate N-acetyltransferase/amino-acid acetyltransferase ArgJ [Streptomyces sp. SID8373]RAJ57955.1 glutamate N-acetyltransferase [Streptomyces sp. KhCrAH-43]
MTHDHALIWPSGFHAHTGNGGLREGGDDISVVASDRPAVSAAVFTRSLFAGPAVVLSRRHAAGRGLRAVATLAQNANVATGRQGEENAAEVVRRVAGILGVPEGEVLIGSTGVIGRPLPMTTILAHFDRTAGRGLAAFTAGPLDVARAMMTTDTRPKTAVRTVGGARIVGVAKGVGMLEPDMATMLAYVFTDAELSPADLDAALRGAVDRTFNCLSVDTDTSTSDTVAVIANGAAGAVDPALFAEALADLCLDLTLQLASDGEGATKLLRVTAGGARDDAQAKRVAKSVVNSPLVKTAVHGADPNWGRVLMAIGKNTEETGIVPDAVTVKFGDIEVYPQEPEEDTLARLVEVMRRDEVDIDITLGLGAGRATVYGCDLSAGYIRVNADYTT